VVFFCILDFNNSNALSFFLGGWGFEPVNSSLKAHAMQPPGKISQRYKTVWKGFLKASTVPSGLYAWNVYDGAYI